MVYAPTTSYQETSGYADSFPSGSTDYSTHIYNHQAQGTLGDDNMTDCEVTIPSQGMGFNPSGFSPPMPTTLSFGMPTTAMFGSVGSFSTPSQPAFNSTSAGTPLFGSSSSQQSLNPTPMGTSMFGIFASSNQPAASTPVTSIANAPSSNPFSSQAPTDGAPIFNPFAAQPIDNPFTVHTSEKRPTFTPGQLQKSTEGGLFSGNRPVFNQAPPTKIHSTPSPSDKTATVENKISPAGISDKSASRQFRFSESTDIGAVYQEAVDERAKRRERLIKDGTIDNPAVPKYLDQAIKFHGTCDTMCPKFEFLQRRYQKMVAIFELDRDGYPNESLFAKSFHRPAAGMDAPLPEDVRTPKALVETLRYLVFEVVKNSPWHECHGFVRDRTRSIRQDFTYQNHEGEEAVICTEIIARFHILALHMMCEQPDHQEYMELEQLDKSLTTLGFIYLDGQVPDAGGNKTVFPNEPEFRAYTILRHLRDRYVEKDDIRKWPTEVVHSKQVQHALKLYQAVQRYERATDYGFHAQHYVKTFFELFQSKDTDFITACLLQVYFPEIRRFSLKTMAENYMKTSKMTSIEFIKDFLCYESLDQAELEIRHYGLSIGQHATDGVPFTYLITGKGQFDVDATKIRTRPHPSLLEPKREPGTPLTDILWGLEHQVRTCTALLIKDENALVQGECQNIEAYYQFGEAEGFFEFGEATMGEYSASSQFSGPSKLPEHNAEFRTHAGSTSVSQMTPMFSVTSTDNGFLNAPGSETPKQVFSINTSTTNGHEDPTATKPSSPFPAQSAINTFPGRQNSVFSNANTSGKAPVFAEQSILNPFAPLPDKITVNANTDTNQKPSSSLFGMSTTPSHVGEKLLFLGDEEALSDEPEEDEGPVAPPNQSFWTTFLTNKTESGSSKLGATSVLDQKAALPSAFRFTNPAPALPAVKATLPGTQSIQQAATLFKPFINSNTTPGVFSNSQTKIANPSNLVSEAVVAEPECAGGGHAAKLRERDETIAKEARQREESIAIKAREEAIAKRVREEDAIAKRVHEEALAREIREQEEAIERELRDREAMEKKAQSFFNRRLIERYFYFYTEQARRQRRRTDRALRQKHRAAYTEDPQWWPIIKDGALYKDSVQKVSQLVFKSAQLELSIPEIVHLALAESKISRATYRVLLHNNDRSGKSEYWFQQKFLGANQEIFVAKPETQNEFHAQLTVTEQEAPEVGFLVFGCSSDFSISNEERFATDCSNLHFIVDHLTRNSTFSKLAVMVICYRSPVDGEPADPNGLDSSRTLGKARRERIELVKTALNFASFSDRVVGKKVAMVETLRDLDLSHELRTFAEDYVLETVNRCYSGDDHPDNTTTHKVERAVISANRKRRDEAAPRKAQGSPRPSLEGKRKRAVVLEVSPRAPVFSRAERGPSQLSSMKRTRDLGLQDTPFKRYCRKKQQQGILDDAKMRTKALIGFSMVLQSPAANKSHHQSLPQSVAPQEVNTANTQLKDRVDKVIENADKTTAEILKFFAENESDSSFL